MASVISCPHCDVQLVVPDRAEADARAECPICGREFLLNGVTRRDVPEVVLSEPTPMPRSKTSAVTLADLGGFSVQSDDGTATDELAQLPTTEPELDGPEESPAHAADPPEDVRLGPTFDLPDVPLAPETSATVDFGWSTRLGESASTDFELDDVDLNVSAESGVRDDVVTLPEYAAVGAALPHPEDGSENAVHSAAEPDTTRSAADVPPMIRPTAGRQRRRSLVGMMVGLATSGIVGLSLGYYILMHLWGPTGDVLELAGYLPPALLPDSFPSATSELADARESAPTVPTEREPASVQASYEATVESDGNRARRDRDDRYGGANGGREPARFGESPATPLTDATGPKRAPSFTSEQLAAALRDAEQAQQGLIAGDLSDTSVRRTKGLSYAKLCDLAQMLTFHDGGSGSSHAAQLRRDAEWLFRTTLADAHTRDEVARIAAIWIESPHRRHGGVFLAGSIHGGQIMGDVYQYELRTDDGRLLVLLAEPLDPRVETGGPPVAVVGAIVDEPADRVAGYAGKARQAIWASRVIPLE